jgi:isopentenyl phosphate kinase
MTGHEPGGSAPGPDTAGHLVFVKLGGSVITDKSQPQTACPAVIDRLAGEVARALRSQPDLRLVLGHGSGSFGHVPARRYGTRQGVRTTVDWFGFAAVAAAAAQLNRLVVDRFLAAGVPVWSLQPSASAWCRGGELVSMATAPLEQALARGLVPLVYGDVALDELQGGTIISTEQILAYLARHFQRHGLTPPERMVLVSGVDGVFEGDPNREPNSRQVPTITAGNWVQVRGTLGGSHVTDVTGGMLSKVEEMIALIRDLPELTVHILSGERSGVLQTVLQEPTAEVGGTVIRW